MVDCRLSLIGQENSESAVDFFWWLLSVSELLSLCIGQIKEEL